MIKESELTFWIPKQESLLSSVTQVPSPCQIEVEDANPVEKMTGPQLYRHSLEVDEVEWRGSSSVISCSLTANLLLKFLFSSFLSKFFPFLMSKRWMQLVM